MNQRYQIIQAEIGPFFATLRAMAERIVTEDPLLFLDAETGEDLFILMMEATAEYAEYLLGLDEQELISLRLRERLN